jgi:DNA-binding transcriptional MerR regulator
MHRINTVLALFGISISTLKRWCRRAHITPHRDPVDNRRRYLDNDQLLKLARLHKRVLIVDADTASIDYLMQLERRIEELEAKLGH